MTKKEQKDTHKENKKTMHQSSTLKIRRVQFKKSAFITVPQGTQPLLFLSKIEKPTSHIWFNNSTKHTPQPETNNKIEESSTH